jgi:uncharacterized protein YkwD
MTVRPRCTLYHLAASCMLVAGSLLAPASTGASSLSEQVIALVNAQRHTIMGDGCPALAPNPVLEDAANRHAADMANRNYFAHNSLVGTTYTARMNQAGYNARLSAENLAAGQPSPEDVVRAWMESPLHRANILDCRFHETGVGYASSPRATFGSYWVQEFGAR